jgi:diguanylate cyclase (GGDEF)-like protein
MMTHGLAQMAVDDVPSFETILDALGHPVLLIEASGLIVYCNKAGQDELGVDLVGSRMTDLLPSFPETALALPFTATLLTSDQRSFRVAMSAAGNRHFVVSLHAMAASLPMSMPQDVDELTGLAKRSTLMATLTNALAKREVGEPGFAVHCIDLDRFKIVNDTLGHGLGDLLLTKVAGRLKSICRGSDLVARVGGDEFVIVQHGVSDVADAERLATRIVDLVGRTYVLEGHTVNIGVSVGVALQKEQTQARDIVRDADLALYEAKRAGKARYRLFEAGMSVALQERRELEIDLRRALALKQFDLHFQPFMELETNKVRGFEALLRWSHPIRGNVPPLAFITIAEETGLIVKIGEWVLRSACLAASSWPDEMIVAVNVSALQFRADNLLSTVQDALGGAGLPAHRLELEITESALLDDAANVVETLRELHGLGVKISMDDFGTGYSSLSYLQKFPFDKIKIDRSFVAEDTEDSRAILSAVAGLGASLGVAITAEGVETAQQLEKIRGHNCTHVQGYFTGRPMHGDRIGDFLGAHSSRNENV